MNEPNLVLTGMMGTGKSSIARIVSTKLNREVIDTDSEIEKHFGKSVRDIFETEGEAAFRKLEFEICETLSKRDGIIISTGGGSLLTQRALRLFDNAEVFCLDATAQTIWERTHKNAKRPLLARDSENPVESLNRIQDLLTERKSAYDRVFHHVKVGHLERKDIAEEILKRFTIGKSVIHARRFLRIPSLKAQAHFVKEGVAFEIPKYLDWAGVKVNRMLVISDEKIASLYKEKISASVSKLNKSCEWISIACGEQHKNLKTVQALYKSLLRVGANRSDVIVAIGGGVVGDLAGFVAATFMRGIPLVQVPTTLLSMVDSSIGGKTGVDLDEGKNLIGAFKQPRMILVDPTFLNTLPKEEYSSGMAEVIKHALIDDKQLFETLEDDTTLTFSDLVTRAIAVKMRIVEEDPFEEGRRTLLNLGHTFGHAIEKVSQYTIRHGFAVSIGMLMACNLAFKLGLSKKDLQERVAKVLEKYHLPTTLPNMDARDILNAMKHDKKWDLGQKNFILAIEIADIRNISVPDDVLIHRTIESLIVK